MGRGPEHLPAAPGAGPAACAGRCRAEPRECEIGCTVRIKDGRVDEMWCRGNRDRGTEECGRRCRAEVNAARVLEKPPGPAARRAGRNDQGDGSAECPAAGGILETRVFRRERGSENAARGPQVCPG